MENNTNKPPTPHIPGNGSPDPLAPAENNSSITDADETDADDAIHAQLPVASEEEKQQDGDEAVHENYTPAASHENEEIDPDDAVHGNS